MRRQRKRGEERREGGEYLQAQQAALGDQLIETPTLDLCGGLGIWGRVEEELLCGGCDVLLEALCRRLERVALAEQVEDAQGEETMVRGEEECKGGEARGEDGETHLSRSKMRRERALCTSSSKRPSRHPSSGCITCHVITREGEGS